MTHAQPHLGDFPFLRSLCWQSANPTLEHLSDLELLELYERNWRYKGVMADLSEAETQFVRQLARHYQSWLVNDV